MSHQGMPANIVPHFCTVFVMASACLHVCKVVCRSTGGKASAFALAETLGAVTAVLQVCQQADSASHIALGSQPAAAHASQAPVQEILQVLCEQSISAAGRKAVGLAVAAVPGAALKLMNLMQVSNQVHMFAKLYASAHHQ